MSEDAIADSIELEESREESEPEEYFNKERTLTLIEFFKKYKPMVAAGSIKTMKQMWEIISVDLINMYQISISSQKCENRFKVLERGYRKMKEILEKGEKPKKMFPYFEEFKDVPRNKKYAIVAGLNSSNYSEYTTVNFNNTVSPPSPLMYVELPNVKLETQNIFQNANTAQRTEQQTSPNVIVGSDIYFNKERTLALIDLYKKYNQKYCERSIKTKRRMWYIIAREMTNLFNVPITGAKCENKLKVLERNYKRGTYFKKRYEFEEELKVIFGDRVIKPVFKKPITLLNSTTIPSTSAAPQQVTIRVLDPKATVADKIETVLLGIRSDFQIYYRERLNLEREKISLKRQKLHFLKGRTQKKKA